MKLFVAGATGATGSEFVPLAAAAGHDLVLHVRPQSAGKTPLSKDPRARVFALGDRVVLAEALRGCEAIVSFVGTMRARFQAGDTYAASDIGSAEQLVGGARVAGVPRLLLLSSWGVGNPGAYLKMKAECERIVRESGLRFTIFRPSALVSAKAGEASHLGQRRPPPGSGLIGALRHLPGLAGFADDVRPIPIAVVCRAFLRVLAEPRDGAVLAGRELWQLGGTPAG